MRIDQLTFTRFFAALFIVIFHFGAESFPFNSASLSFIISQANVGVSYFFILSGFVMIVAYGNQERINAWSFLKNRVVRIYPVYFLSLLLLFIYYVAVLLVKVDPYDLLLNITLLKSWIPNKATSFNSPAWTLSVELFFYLLFPLLFNCFYRKENNLSKFIGVMVTIWVISQVVLHWFIYSPYYKGYPSESHNFIYYWPLMHLNEFLIGNLAGLFFLKLSKHKTGNYDGYIVGLVVLMLIALKYHGPLIFHNGLLAILFVPLILLLSLNTGRITLLLKNKYMVFLGEISFGMYILQIPLYVFCMLLFDKISIQDPYTRFYFFVLLLIAFSALTYLVIEHPLRRKMKQKSRAT